MRRSLQFQWENIDFRVPFMKWLLLCGKPTDSWFRFPGAIFEYKCDIMAPVATR